MVLVKYLMKMLKFELMMYLFSVFGIVGFIVYFGLFEIGKFREGEIVVVFVVVGLVGLIVG